MDSNTIISSDAKKRGTIVPFICATISAALWVVVLCMILQGWVASGGRSCGAVFSGNYGCSAPWSLSNFVTYVGTMGPLYAIFYFFISIPSAILAIIGFALRKTDKNPKIVTFISVITLSILLFLTATAIVDGVFCDSYTCSFF